MMNPAQRSAVPPIVMQLLIANGVLFVLTAFMQLPLDRYFALWPIGPETVTTADGVFLVPSWMPWQLLTYGFLHANLGHIFFNMFALWMFGSALENHWGSRRFLFFYLVCVIGAGIVQTAVASIAVSSGSFPYATVGASGGVFGILLGFGMLFPNHRIMLLIPPVPMKAKYFVIGYGALTLFFGMTGTQAGVAHFAHLGGMLFGFLTILYWRHANKPRR